MVRLNLFVDYYDSANPIRQKELDFCISLNASLRYFDQVFVLTHSTVETGMIKKLAPSAKIIELTHIPRPTFGQFYSLINLLSKDNDDVNVLTNTDIAFDYTIELARKMKSNTVLALCRYDSKEMILPLTGTFHNVSWSQDVWITRGITKSLEDIPFGMGKVGCDNVLIALFRQKGFIVLNPSFDIKTYHIHMSDIRTYKVEDAVPGARGYVAPTHFVE